MRDTKKKYLKIFLGFYLSTSAQGPYDWLQHWWNASIVSNGTLSALQEISPGRENTASRCNILDSSYATAANLANGNGGSCESWDWIDQRTQSALYGMTFGEDRVGAYAEDSRYNSGTTSEKIFKACGF
ncbi:hypothetical protein ACFL15_01550 [Patescibacteria group bacterium]